jgi:hypothetical protein
MLTTVYAVGKGAGMAIIFASRIVSFLERRSSRVCGFPCAQGAGFNFSSLISPFRERQRIRDENWNKDCEGCTSLLSNLHSIWPFSSIAE